MKKKNYIEIRKNRKEKYRKVANYILAAAAVGTTLAIAITMPNALRAFAPILKGINKKLNESEFDQGDFNKYYEKIKKDRLVRIVKKSGRELLQITERGRKKLVEFNIDTISIKEGKWDDTWKLVIFDIPEKYRTARDVLRSKLKEIGFVKMQKSVWICPYECQDEISYICQIYSVEEYVNYVIAKKIDNEEYFKNKFEL